MFAISFYKILAFIFCWAEIAIHLIYFHYWLSVCPNIFYLFYLFYRFWKFSFLKCNISSLIKKHRGNSSPEKPSKICGKIQQTSTASSLVAQAFIILVWIQKKVSKKISLFAKHKSNIWKRLFIPLKCQFHLVSNFEN